MSSNPAVERFGIYLRNKEKEKEKDQLLRAPLAWVGTIRRESTREERAEIFSRQQCKARTVVGRGGKRLLCDPGSELRLGGRDNRRAKIINGMRKKEKEEEKV